MGEEKKGNGGEGGRDEVEKKADEAARRVRESADDVKKRAMGWLLAAKDADRLDAAHRAAKRDYDEATAAATEKAEELMRVLSEVHPEGRIRTHRVFLPSDPNVDATIVEVTTGSAKPRVEAHAVDFVA